LSRPLKAFLEMDEMVFWLRNLPTRDGFWEREQIEREKERVSRGRRTEMTYERRIQGQDRVAARFSDLVTLTGLPDCSSPQKSPLQWRISYCLSLTCSEA
jgi:hypothetical protein